MSSPISGGGGTFQPIHMEPNYLELENHLRIDILASPPNYNDMYNYITANAQAMQDAGVPTNTLNAALQNIAQYQADPDQALFAASGLLVILYKAHQ